jgi:hypothetical protein
MGGFDLKTFRATRATDWLRPKWLGGFGYDIQTVRDLLGHDEDSESIWSYLRAVEKEVLVAEMNKAEENSLPADRRGGTFNGPVVISEDGAIAVTGVPVAQSWVSNPFR